MSSERLLVYSGKSVRPRTESCQNSVLNVYTNVRASYQEPLEAMFYWKKMKLRSNT